MGRQFLFSTCVGEGVRRGFWGLESGGAKARDQGCSYQTALGATEYISEQLPS